MTQSVENDSYPQRFVRALREVLVDDFACKIENIDLNTENNLHRGIDQLPELTVSFTAEMTYDDIRTFMLMVLPPPEVVTPDDERLSEISREFADTLFLKSL